MVGLRIEISEVKSEWKFFFSIDPTQKNERFNEEVKRGNKKRTS